MSGDKDIQRKEEEDIVEATPISDEQHKKALIAAAAKSFAGAVPGLREFIGTVNNINDEVREEKLKNLLHAFRHRFESVEAAQKQFEFIVGTRGGMLLFHKIIQIVDDGPLDEEWLNLLASVLAKVSDENIEEQFEERNYILSQISSLSAHALILLNKSEHWHTYKFQRSSTMSGQTIVGDWDTQLSNAFARNVGIEDEDTKMRIAHAFKELEKAGMVYLTEGKTLGCTQIGARVQAYIS